MSFWLDRVASLARDTTKWILLASFGLLVASATARAQGQASVGGVVTDATGTAIPSASVKIKSVETGAVRTVVTGTDGHYIAPLLPVGNYEVSGDKTGFEEAKAAVTLVLGESASINLTLSVKQLEQVVQVEESAVAVSATTTDISGLVGEQEVKNLPLNGRSYDQLLTLNPGVVNYSSQRAGGAGASNSVVGNMFSASGRRPQENLFLLNGVEFTSASEINNTPGGTSGQLLGVDAVREFSVETDTYGAEYGKRPGAQVNIVTASGTNQLHGSAYEFLRNSSLDARNYFDEGPIPNFERNVFGGSLGGPIKRDKTFLFANYEGFRQVLDLSDVTLVPDAATRTAMVSSHNPNVPLLALWPLANGPELGGGIAESFSHPEQTVREDFGTARIDQNFSEKDSLAGVYTVDDSSSISPTANPITVDDVYLREQVASVNETHVFSANLLNLATAGYSRGGFYFTSGTTVGLPGWINSGDPVGAVVVGGGTTLNGASQITNGGTNAGSNLSNARNLYTLRDQLTWTHGRHTFAFGAWLEDIQSNDSLIQDQYGQISFSSFSGFASTTPTSATISTYTYAPNHATPLSWRTLEGAWFVEDTIKVRPSLEVRVGFRAESTNGWNESLGRASNYTYNANGVLLTQPALGSSALAVNKAAFLPEPRVGIAWSPLKKTVIRAGLSLSYALLDNLSYRLDQDPPYNTVLAVKGVTATGAGHTLLFSNISPTTNYSALGYNDSVIPSGVQPDLLTPAVVSYTLKIEQQIFDNTTLSVGYIGSHGYHELLSIDANVPSAPYPYPTQVITAASTGLANPSLWNSTTWLSEGDSSYNALQVDVNHRFAHGLQFRGVYTFAKALDDGDSLNTSVATNAPAFVENPLDPRADYGRASFDIRDSAVINATYDLPFAKKAGSGNTLAREALGDWQISGIETLQTGLPFTPQLAYNPSNDGDTRNPVRPSWNPAFTGSVIEGVPGQYFNPAAFIQPAAGTYGNVGRNILQGPGLAELDFSAAKKFFLSERFNLQFRAELFNLFNRANFNTPNPVIFAAAAPAAASPTAGVITATSTTSRQVQFGLKLLW